MISGPHIAPKRDLREPRSADEAMINLKSWIPSIFYTSRFEYAYSKQHYLWLGGIVIIGIWLRVWGLGNIGLHGDEKTMVLPALQILEYGVPYLPSEILYPRGLGQLYLMAASAWLFGPSEWAFRIPSVLAGIAAIPIAFYLGRRFLPPYFNLAFVLTIAVFPEMIIQSQTARMYIFLAVFVMLFSVLLFRWERRQTWFSLWLATGCLLVALLFHQLAIFSVFLFFFPGLLYRSARFLLQGLVAFTIVVGAFLPFRQWIEAQYGETWTLTSVQGDVPISALQFLAEGHSWILAACAAVLFAALGWFFYGNREKSASVLWSGALVAAGSVACILLYYHVGLILVAIGAIACIRAKGSCKQLVVVGSALIALFAVQAFLLSQSPEVLPGLKEVIRAMNGQPSTWPYLKLASYFPLAAIAYALIGGYAVVQIANGDRIPDHFLFFVLAVWLPVFAIGLFDWHIPRRYTYSFVALSLTCLVAGMHYVVSQTYQDKALKAEHAIPILLVVLLALTVNPTEFQKVVDRDYESAPDHKGAGLFLKNKSLDRNDVVLAEDVLQQTYYFGDVDYWLRSVKDASGRVKKRDGELYNYMNDVPLIGSGSELSTLFDREGRGAIYVIGSGEKYYVDRRGYYLGNGIAEVLEKNVPEIIFRGRDGETVVMYFPPPSGSGRPSAGT